MRRSTWALALSIASATGFVSSRASAGFIADENAKPGISGDWPARNDGTAASEGVVDAYPAAWSIAQGEKVRLKVRSTTGYAVRVMRLGWYGGTGAHEVKVIEGLAADPQPYPTPDPEFGLAEARWHDSLSFDTDASWTPGVYVARIERPDGKEATTFFVIRDDALAEKPSILFVSTIATHQAYNAWPGMNRGGKSLYDFNSSPVSPKASLYAAAVKVSFDRPFLVGAGTADLGMQEYPAIRFLERNGWDVAYATEQDLHLHPELMNGRRAVLVVGHAEYWSRPMFDGALAARDAGVSYMFMSGNTLGWQIRFEPGPNGPASTEIGYKNSFVRDPEQKAAKAALAAGDVEGAKAHFRMVTRGWRQLEYDPAHGIDVRQPSMVLTGIQSTAMMGTAYPWGDLQITTPDHWLFEGTGVKSGDRIKGVMGYEVDSTKKGDPEWDHFRPPNQVRLGTIRKSADDSAQGSAGAYWKDLGGGRRAEVIALSAIEFSWALDGWAHGGADCESDVAKAMVTNALRRWTSATLPTDPGDGHDTDPNGDPNGDPGGPDQDQGGSAGAQSKSESARAGGCSIGEMRSAAPMGLVGAALAVGLARAARRRRRTRRE